MTQGDPEPGRGRAARSPSSSVERERSLRVAARSIVIRVRRLQTRLGPVLRPSMLGDALKWTLLDRLDVTGYNAAGPPRFDRIESQACSAAQVRHPAYADWAARMGDLPRFNRKQWEHVTILEAARQAGMLTPGRSAVGFGVGTEPIPALLASFGLTVLATDQAETAAAHWTSRDEHAASLEALVKPDILDPALLRERVRFRTVDMNRIPEDLGTYDMVWSSCAMEHLGSPESGLEFVKRSLSLLRPGGLAVHTTEFDLTPGEDAVDYGHCALYRRIDLERLQQEILTMGYSMTLNPYVAFEHPADRAIAPPVSVGTERFHLKLALHDSVTTSFALVIHRPLPRRDS